MDHQERTAPTKNHLTNHVALFKIIYVSTKYGRSLYGIPKSKIALVAEL